ncbi:MAG: hypothetical protein RIC16_04775 [Rhodospirillales bacterium]
MQEEVLLGGQIYPGNTVSSSDFDPTIIDLHGLRAPLNLWRKESSQLAGPYWNDVNLLDLPDDLRGGTMVADYQADSGDFYIRYWGSDLVTAFGVELSQKRLSDANHRGVMDSFVKTAAEIIDRAEPQFMIHEITSARGVRRQFPVLRMPIFNSGGVPDKVMTVENIRLCISQL